MLYAVCPVPALFSQLDCVDYIYVYIFNNIKNVKQSR